MTTPAYTSTLFPGIRKSIPTIAKLANEVPEGRRKEWRKLARYVRQKQAEGQTTRVMFVCTHNSRRSVFGQVWMAVIADYLGLEKVETFSTGSEETHVAPQVLDLFRALEMDLKTKDKVSKLHYAETKAGIALYSKTLEDDSLPSSDFAAVMVCDPDDGNCPFIPGADLRISIPFPDPKKSDGSPLEPDTYRHVSFQIAGEIFYAFDLV